MKRMLRAWPVAVASTALLAVIPRDARPGPYSVEPCLKSKLCNGLVEHFSFEEASDSARYGAFGSTLHESGGQNVANTAGKIGNAASFDGTASKYLWSSTFVPSMGSSWSMSFWIRVPSLPSAGNFYYFMGRNGPTGNPGSMFYIDSSGNICTYVISAESTSSAAACTTISAATPTFIAGGFGDPDDTPGSQQVWISKDGAAKVPVTPTPTFFPRSGLSHFRVGQIPTGGKGSDTTVGSLNGWIDELDVYGRSIGISDITLLYNGGSGRTYPYETE